MKIVDASVERSILQHEDNTSSFLYEINGRIVEENTLQIEPWDSFGIPLLVEYTTRNDQALVKRKGQYFYYQVVKMTGLKNC